MDGQLTEASTSSDLSQISLDVCHPLTGPIEVDGAEPGDVLIVEVVSIETSDFGTTLVVPPFGLLRDAIKEPLLLRWRISDGVARSPDLPNIAIRGAPFLGILGVAPSEELFAAIVRREGALAESRDVFLPTADGAAPVGNRFARQGLRTIPPRENGGNLDFKELRAGSRLYLPVHVQGACLSLGDVHFAQGDGECCGTAIEVSATVELRTEIRKAADLRWTPRMPAVEFTAVGPPKSRPYFATTGIPVTIDGENAWLDLLLAAQRATEEMLEYLTTTRGLTVSQAYAVTSIAGDLRIANIVDIPNGFVALALPLDIFEN